MKDKARLDKLYQEICAILSEMSNEYRYTKEESKVLEDMQNLKESTEKLLFIEQQKNTKQLKTEMLASLEELNPKDLEFISNVIQYFANRGKERKEKSLDER